MSYVKITATVFTFIALAHLARAMTGVEFIIAGWQVPVGFNYVASLLTGILAYIGFSRKD